jgi:hypothetical protein
MSSQDSKTLRPNRPTPTKSADKAGGDERGDTFSRLRSALLEDRLAVMEGGRENTGTDPYNSGIHRAMAKAHVWGKRSR